jgi:hypothetical protein
VLPWHNVGRLIERGIAKRGINHRCVFRSPLVHARFVAKFAPVLKPLQDIAGLTQREECLVSLPQVSMLLLNRPLQRNVEERLAEGQDAVSSGESRSFWESTYVDNALPILEELSPRYDEQGMQYFIARYFPEYVRPAFEREDMYRLVAKVFAKWAADMRRTEGS